MKTKLLKKVRRRFQILYYPNGQKLRFGGTLCPHYEVIDRRNKYNNQSFYIHYKGEEKRIFEEAYRYLLTIIKKEYAPKTKYPVKKVWWKAPEENSSQVKGNWIQEFVKEIFF